MPKQTNQTTTQPVELTAALEHLRLMSVTDLEISSCETALAADEATLAQLRNRRGSITDEAAMRELSREQRAAEQAAQDNQDRFTALANKRRLLREATPKIYQHFAAAYNVLAEDLTAQFERRYQEFLDNQVRPLLELGQALSAVPGVRNIANSISLQAANGRMDYARNGSFTIPPKTLSPEAKTAAESIAPWAMSNQRLQEIQREVEREEHKSRQARTRPTMTPPSEYLPIETGKPWPRVEHSGTNVAHMNPGAFQQQQEAQQAEAGEQLAAHRERQEALTARYPGHTS